MKIIKNRSIILIIFIFYSISSLDFLIKEKKIFTYENKSVEYTLEQVFKEGYKLYFYDIEFERVDKVGENDSYFAIFSYLQEMREHQLCLLKIIILLIRIKMKSMKLQKKIL